jgi:predicted O-methyltransferase YrrM
MITIAEAVATADRVKGYMYVQELRWLAETAQALSPPAAWCEIGSWQGRSATAVAAALPPHSRLQLVDNFTGPTTREAPKKADVRRQLQASIVNMQKRSPTLRVDLAIGFSAQVAPSFPDGSFDVIFIDGDHAYAAVVDDIRFWTPKLKPNGLLCGHDFTNKCGVEPAVRELCPGFAQVPITSLWYWRRSG